MKNILVTGANKGIGLAVVSSALSEHLDARLILASRNAERGKDAVATLLSTNPAWKSRLATLELDVTSDNSVEQARDALPHLLEGNSLYGLVNNAGLGLGSTREVMDVNVHGIRRTSDAFADMMPDGGRIINVTSASGPNFVSTCSAERKAYFCDPGITWESLSAFIIECGELDATTADSLGLGSTSPYGFSKACANSYTLCLARENPRLMVNACTPGFIETDLAKDFLAGRTPSEAGMKSPADGARVIMQLLFAPARSSGWYYGSDGLRSPLDRYRAPGSAEYAGE